MYRNTHGFTLIELMVTVVIIAVLAAIAVPSYQAYILRANESQAKVELERLAVLLERHKSRNFNYKGFDREQIHAVHHYTIVIVDGNQLNLSLTDDAIAGQNWAMKAISNTPENFTLLLTSQGVRCKNKTTENVTFTHCGEASVGREEW